KTSQLDRFPSPRRFVNRHEYPQVPQPLFARCQWLLVIHHALRHVVHLQSEMITLAQLALFARPSLPPAHSQTCVTSRRLQFGPAFRTNDSNSILSGVPVARRALRERA